ncbi:MAG: hypothetical protein EBZ77_10760 [Chitinophagia bacterium]|nr:hypothetical protein [Chitinophagia bacterium]
MEAQTTMNIYQSNGSVLQIPLSTIDSITYTIGNPGQLATLSTLPVGNISNTSATSGGNITTNGGTPVTQRGVVWSTSPSPTTANNQSSDGSGTGNYTSNLTGLSANTTYYVRAYATNSAGTAYGNELSFTTAGGAGSITALNCGGGSTAGTLTAGIAASGVSSTVLYTGGNGGSYTGQTVSSTGVTGLTATLSAGNFSNGAGSLTYTITGTPGTGGTASFVLNVGGQNCTLSRTVNAPVGSITALNCNSATNNGTLTAGTASSGVNSSVPYTGGNGGSYNSQTVSSTGVTGLTASLTAGNFANGAGSLTYTITGTPSAAGTASFALNIGGQNCTLNLTVNAGSGIVSNPGAGVTYGGVNYPTVVLGNGQEWMAQNLNTTQYNDGTAIPLVTDTNQWAANYNNGTTLPMMCWYNNDQATYTANTFGALYNWYAVSPTTNGNRNVCPTGWHVPSDAEWSVLINYLDPNANGGNTNPNVAGGKMKSTGTQYWLSPNQDATNESGFSGLPGGARGNGVLPFVSIGEYGYWWSSTEDSTTNAWLRYLGYTNGNVGRITNDKGNGFSVRCLRD